ncbi:hypothetical protein BDF22DRAFT_670369 [Syncephalis plumigaleata]|nr:hypothetical protein BDF22DRAFT_670369 [Syncephalis plumigaleata]
MCILPIINRLIASSISLLHLSSITICSSRFFLPVLSLSSISSSLSVSFASYDDDDDCICLVSLVIQPSRSNNDM